MKSISFKIVRFQWGIVVLLIDLSYSTCAIVHSQTRSSLTILSRDNEIVNIFMNCKPKCKNHQSKSKSSDDVDQTVHAKVNSSYHGNKILVSNQGSSPKYIQRKKKLKDQLTKTNEAHKQTNKENSNQFQKAIFKLSIR